MLTYRSWLGLLMAIALVTAGCSDDSGPSGNEDGGTQDITVLPDGTVTPTPDGTVTPTPDGYVPQPDGPVTNTCETACMEEAPFLCLDAGNGCVECTTDSHCLGNPNSFGPSCDSSNGWCTCSGDAQCATNPNGKVCEPDYTACSCTDNSDCPTGKACTVVVAPADPANGDPGLKICGDACTDNSDCTADSSKPFCDTRSGNCVACLTDGDCTDDEMPYCGDVGGGDMQCVECTDNTECAGSKYGDQCDQNFCTCTDATNCAYPKAWGGACVEHSTSFGTYMACGCDNADNSQCDEVTDAAGTGTFDSAYGTVCNVDYSVCSCTDTNQCSDTDWDTCGLVGAGDTIQQCQAGCTDNTDCTAVENGLDVCDTASGRCIECDANNACSDGVCDLSINACVECLADTDCSDSAPKCSPENVCVACLDNADCTDNIYGTKCGDDGSCGCAADTDCSVDANGPTCEGADPTAGELGFCNCTPPATGDPDPCAEAGNANGKVCQEYLYGGFIPINGCGCNDATTDCGTGQKCGLTEAYSLWDSCQEPCTDNGDCTGEGLGVCDTTTSVCIGCATHADCTYTPYENVCGTDSLCVECDANNACGANSLGPNCDATYGYCECATDADCATNGYGNICDGDLVICSCDPADSAGTCPSGKACTGEAWGTPICE